ncbi:MAG: FAD-dependent oxidoreductase [Alphaproteobacteria bacterium]|jgi:sarcosine oxidase subunit beta|nr:FAD-dependent oxidoreductase [Alphaproteobacteria bacterium]MDP6567214.1 FAD-dependent oxidoreductase [Alphaproteobacteria bacterium]MDP6813463.1 FAD-dependent oxidoreductase [Alphaproteobacteria bacterium]
MSERYDAIIIGAGIIGACVGLELARRGWRSLNLDRLPAAGYGSTGASCAIIRSHYSTLDGTAMAIEGYHHWRDWAGYLKVDDERGPAIFHEVGCAVMKTESNQFMGPICRNLDELGIAWEDWDGEVLRRRMPFYDLRHYGPAKGMGEAGFGEPTGGELPGAVFMPQAGYISDPQLATHNVQRAAEAAGGAFRFNAEVIEIRRAGGRIAGVSLADGSRIDAPVLVNVAGPHSAVVNGLAGIDGGMKIGTRALRQEVAHVPSPAGFDYERDGCVTSDGDIACYGRPEVGNHILIGSEDPPCDPREWVDPDDFNTEFTEQWQAQVLRYAQRIPELPIPGQAKGVVALYDVTDDWIPIYDKSDLPGFYLAIGSSGNQFKNAPVAGALMAELIVRCQDGHDHDAEPVRWRYRYTDRECDIGFFSRNREINEESSFSVLG